MAKFLRMMMLVTVTTMLPAAAFFGCALAKAADTQDEPTKLSGKVSLVRGVLKRLDPIHDQLFVHAFGGHDIRIAFDPRTEFLAENTRAHLSSIPTGSVVSVDTVIEGGKLFARSVRMSPTNAGEVDGQVVRYNADKSQLTLRDPLSPEGISLRLTSSTTVLEHGQPAASQSLSPGMLVRVWFSPAENVVSKVEVLAERGTSFTFAGHVVAVDLHSRVLAVSNDTDQSLRELAIGSLDAASLRLLTEGADVSVQAEFDGDRYNARAVTLVSRNP
jgi:hypothetical protein